MPRRGENIRKRADGRWEARYIRDYQSDGKARYGYLYAKTYMDVKKKKAQAQVNTSSRLADGRDRPKCLGNVLEAWLQSREGTVKQSTFSQYSTVVKRHLIPSLGLLKLDSFSNISVEEYIKSKRKNGRLDGKGALSPKTLADQIVILKQVIRFAVASGWMQAGKLSFHIPASKAFRPELVNELDWMRLNRLARTPQSPQMLGVLIAMHTGLRIGEVCALRFSDVDFDTGVLSVNQTVLRIKNMDAQAKDKTKVILNSPKTECSRRSIPLPVFLLSLLQHALLSASSKDAFIITGAENCTEPRVFYRKYQSMLKQCGAGQYTFHALRHTFATKCIENGCDPKTLSELLGHSSIKITLERYVHPSMNTKRAAVERLANMDLWSENMVAYG